MCSSLPLRLVVIHQNDVDEIRSMFVNLDHFEFVLFPHNKIQQKGDKYEWKIKMVCIYVYIYMYLPSFGIKLHKIYIANRIIYCP